MNIAEAKRTAIKYDLELWYDRSQKIWIMTDNKDRVPEAEYFTSSHMHSMDWTYFESRCRDVRQASNDLDDGPFDYSKSMILDPKLRKEHVVSAND